MNKDVLSGLLGLFDHYDSKKLAALVKVIFAEFAMLAVSAMNSKYQLGIPDGNIQAAMAGVAGAASAYILAQGYSDGKTNGETSGVPEPRKQP